MLAGKSFGRISKNYISKFWLLPWHFIITINNEYSLTEELLKNNNEDNNNKNVTKEIIFESWPSRWKKLNKEKLWFIKSDKHSHSHTKIYPHIDVYKNIPNYK